jgi:hypothetical protein
VGATRIAFVELRDNDIQKSVWLMCRLFTCSFSFTENCVANADECSSLPCHWFRRAPPTPIERDIALNVTRAFDKIQKTPSMDLASPILVSRARGRSAWGHCDVEFQVMTVGSYEICLLSQSKDYASQPKVLVTFTGSGRVPCRLPFTFMLAAVKYAAWGLRVKCAEPTSNDCTMS